MQDAEKSLLLWAAGGAAGAGAAGSAGDADGAPLRQPVLLLGASPVLRFRPALRFLPARRASLRGVNLIPKMWDVKCVSRSQGLHKRYASATPSRCWRKRGWPYIALYNCLVLAALRKLLVRQRRMRRCRARPKR